MLAPGLRLTAFLLGVSVVAASGLVCPGAQKARTARGGGPTRGTAAGHGSPCTAARHGPPRIASGNGAARRTGVPSGSAATASGHGAASDARATSSCKQNRPAFH